MKTESHTQQLNPDTGKWEDARPLPYYADKRPFLLKLVEFPFRLIGLIKYDPLTKEQE